MISSLFFPLLWSILSLYVLKSGHQVVPTSDELLLVPARPPGLTLLPVSHLLDILPSISELPYHELQLLRLLGVLPVDHQQVLF